MAVLKANNLLKMVLGALMSNFRFSLHGLLQLRHRELRELELCAAAEAEQAAAARREHDRLWMQLDAQADVATSQKWLIFHDAASSLRQQAALALQRAARHETLRQQWDAHRAAKQSQVDALELLCEQQRQAHRRAARRREQSRTDELLLRQWQEQRIDQTPDLAAEERRHG